MKKMNFDFMSRFVGSTLGELIKELNLNAVEPGANSALTTGWIGLLLHALVRFVVNGVSHCFII